LSCVPKSLNDVVEIRPFTIPNAGNGLFAKHNLSIAIPLGFYFGIPTIEDKVDQNKDKIGRRALGQAEDISEPIVCARDSEEDEIDFSDDGQNEEEEEELLYNNMADIDDENINMP
ncbi:14449_t:CDS:2, partial [Gigaspora rosea]